MFAMVASHLFCEIMWAENTMQQSINPNRQIHIRALVLLTGILVIAALFRFIWLDYAPAGGHGDVSWLGINALDWVDRGIWPFYVREMYSPEFFPVYLTGLLLPLTGVAYLPLRIITAAAGVLFVAFLYPATYWLIGPKQPIELRVRAGLLSALAGAVSLHIIAMNRLGMESPPFLTVVTLLTWLTAMAWWRSDETGRYRRWALAGAALGLAQYIYLPARLLPVVLILWIIHGYLTDRARLKNSFKGWLVMAFVSFLITLPAILLFISVPESFSGRADAGTATTGGWVWEYDTTASGGVVGLTLAKLGLTLQAFGISWQGPYNIMNQPMLGPVFFLGLLLALAFMIRTPTRVMYAWPLLAIPVLLITDIISGAIIEIHALHQMGVLPYACILAGIGLAQIGDLSFIRHHPRYKLVLTAGVLVAALVPPISGMNTYLNTVIPAQYADPESSWRRAQTDVDLAARLNAEPERAYLLPYSEYLRPDVAWNLAAQFRQRQSAISADGSLQIDNPPAEITIIQMQQPERARHDGHAVHTDPHLWVLLHANTIYLLPPISEPQIDSLGAALAETPTENLVDRSGQIIAHLTPIPTPAGLFDARPVIEYPVDAIFNDEIRLLGYSINSRDLKPGGKSFVTLYWQALKPPAEDYEIFAQVWNDQQEAISSAHEFPFNGMYRSRIWLPEEVVATHHWLEMPEELAHGRYTLVSGLFRYLRNENVVVSGAQADAQLNIVRIPDLRYPLPALTAAEILAPLDEVVPFGDTLELVGLDVTIDGMQRPLDNLSAQAGELLSLTLSWNTVQQPAADYSLFIHLSSDDNSPPLAQFDGIIGQGYPTGAWRSGERIASEASLQLPVDLPAGTYKLLIGIYDWQTGARLQPPQTEVSPYTDGRYLVATLSIGAPSG